MAENRSSKTRRNSVSDPIRNKENCSNYRTDVLGNKDVDGNDFEQEVLMIVDFGKPLQRAKV
jgi:hypothetical protein